MRVAFLKSRIAYPGGLEKYTRKLSDAFVQAGCDVTLLTTGEAPDLPSVHVKSLGPDRKFTLSHLTYFDRACTSYLEKHPAKVVFGMERTSHQTHYRAGSGVHKQFLRQRALSDSWAKRLTFACNPLHRTLLKLEKRAFEDPGLRRLFVNSEMVKREIRRDYSTPEEKLTVVHNGVEFEEFAEAFAKRTPKTDRMRLLFVGNGYRRKGLLFLLQALREIDGYHLTVVGKDKHQAKFETWVRKWNLSVNFVGQQSSILPYLQQNDALVIPSIYDPFANVTLEALAMGLFVVSSPFNGGCEVLRPETGAVIEELSSPSSVAESLKKAFVTTTPPEKIRASISHLDFSSQLGKIVTQTLEDVV